jgi:hypothetical protein
MHKHINDNKNRQAEQAAAALAARAVEDAAWEVEKARLKENVVCDPDLEKMIAEDTIRWHWIVKRNAFCQLTHEADIAVVCHCAACKNDMGAIPVCPQHCSCCACKDCVCFARRETGRFDPNAGPVEPYWDSACQCEQCLGEVSEEQEYCPCHYGENYKCAKWMMFNKQR